MNAHDRRLYNLGQFGQLLDKNAKARIRAKIDAINKEEKRQKSIRSNVCPACNGKLVRGPRNKHNDYKRTWGCIDCFEIHTI